MSFGSDPEFFVEKNGKIISATEVIRGDVDNRIEKNGHEFYYDNVLAECAIKPGETLSEVLKNFKECFQLYANMIKPCRLIVKACHTFNKEQLNHPAARKVACSIEFDAYLLKAKEPPVYQIEKTEVRTGGGHVHLGHPSLISDGVEPIYTIYMMDLFLGVLSLDLDKDPTSKERRSLYGGAGSYRPKTYGIEYRSLGNFWLNSPKLVSLIYNLSEFVVDFVASGKASEFWQFDQQVFFYGDNPAEAYKCVGYDLEKLINGINNTDKSLLADHEKLIRNLLPDALNKEIDDCISARFGDFYQEWKIN